jgi:hypothetical protein
VREPKEEETVDVVSWSDEKKKAMMMLIEMRRTRTRTRRKQQSALGTCESPPECACHNECPCFAAIAARGHQRH